MLLRDVFVMCVLLASGCAPAERRLPHAAVAPERGDEKGAQREEEKKTPEKPVGDSAAIDLSKLDTLAQVIESVAGKKIVYVGEYHDRFSHHAVQLEVIKSLYAKNPKLAVGMEMFQRPFQNVLDEYIAGAIPERQFLKKSEYFNRWGFDYNLYKPILDFCREKKVPVVALNARREITEKVAKQGLDALSEDEKKEVPDGMDLSDEEYRRRLKEVFEKHANSQEKNFEFFYQAQVLWDETMAFSLDQFLKKNPDHRMVVIAGSGHVARGWGIPKRAFRRNGLEYAVILNDGDVEKGIAHYLVFPEEREGETAPKLMATLMDEGGSVVVTAVANGGAAKAAGLRQGDRIVSLDGEAVADVQDVKIALFSKKKGDALRVRVLRKRFFFGDQEMDIEVKL